MPFVESTLQLADAVVTAINGHDFGAAFTAVRAYETRSTLGSGLCRVVITPKMPEVADDEKRLTLTLTVWKKIGSEPTNAVIDPLWNLFFAIRDLLAKQVFSVNNEWVIWQAPGNPEHDREVMTSERVFAISDDMTWLQPLSLEDNTGDVDE